MDLNDISSPARLTLVARTAPRHDVTNAISFGIVDSICGKITLDFAILHIEPQAIPTILTRLSKLCFQPFSGYVVIGNGSLMIVVLFFIILYFLLEVFVQHRLVKIIGRAIEKHNVLQLCRTGCACVDPLTVDKKEVPIKDGNLPFDR